MPNYDYQCSKCSHTLEVFQKITESPLTVCPQCQSHTLQRGPGGGIGLIFKGSGFYINDYAPTQKSISDSSGSSCCPCGKNTSSHCLSTS